MQQLRVINKKGANTEMLAPPKTGRSVENAEAAAGDDRRHHHADRHAAVSSECGAHRGREAGNSVLLVEELAAETFGAAHDHQRAARDVREHHLGDRFAPPARALGEAVKSWRLWPLVTVDAERAWTRGRVALVGDASPEEALQSAQEQADNVLAPYQR